MAGPEAQGESKMGHQPWCSAPGRPANTLTSLWEGGQIRTEGRNQLFGCYRVKKGGGHGGWWLVAGGGDMRSPLVGILPSRGGGGGAQPAGLLPVTQDSQAERARSAAGSCEARMGPNFQCPQARAAATSAPFAPCWQSQASERLMDLVHSFFIYGSDSLLPHQHTSLPGKIFPTHHTDKSFCI